jgi:raffinose/stachyose/melibiose transport system permease protein
MVKSWILQKKKRKDIRPYLLLTLPAFSLFLFFFIIPMLSGLYFSLTNWNGISQTWSFNGLANFRRMFNDPALYDSLQFSFVYAVLVVSTILPLSIILAILLNKIIRLKALFRAIYFFPAMLSMIVSALIWKNIFYHFIPDMGRIVGIEFLQKSLFSSKDTAILGILIIEIWQGTAIPMVIILAGLQSIPQELYEVATLDGANPGQQFRYITLPFLVPVLQMVLMLLIKSGILVYEYVFATTEGGPGRATLSITLLILHKALGYRGAKVDFSYGITFSVLVFAIIAVLSVIQLRLTSKREVGQL